MGGCGGPLTHCLFGISKEFYKLVKTNKVRILNENYVQFKHLYCYFMVLQFQNRLTKHTLTFLLQEKNFNFLLKKQEHYSTKLYPVLN